MKLAINISGAAKCLEPMTFFEKVEFAKGCGVDAIELHPYKEWPGEGQFPFAGVEVEEAKRIRECCAALNGLSIHALMGQTFSSDDPACETRPSPATSSRFGKRSSSALTRLWSTAA